MILNSVIIFVLILIFFLLIKILVSMKDDFKEIKTKQDYIENKIDKIK